jgi:hypothetical protein
MQLMPRSPRSYLKPYAQHHQHMPLPSMYQDHHIPSQDMCLNQVPTCTMHQPCINLYLNLYHQPCTITSASTMHQTCITNIPCTIPCANHVHQPSTHVPYHVCQPCTSTMPISPRCASSTMPTSSVQHAPQSCAKPRTKLCLNKYYTNINKTCIQSCTSNHVPQVCAKHVSQPYVKHVINNQHHTQIYLNQVSYHNDIPIKKVPKHQQ